MSMILKDCSPSKTITATNLGKIASEEARTKKLGLLARTNLENTRRLLVHNKSHDINVFRLSSRLIPLATHPLTRNWDWERVVGQELKCLGEYARKHNFRISAHPDHYTLLNSPREAVLETAVKDLEYHHRLFMGMGMGPEAKLVIHVGGSYQDKTKSIRKFIENYNQLPSHLRNRIVLENDDKTYTVRDVLSICDNVGIPMVLDVHHHNCNNNNDDISTYIPAIFNTWENQALPPKIHFSSPRSLNHARSHADNIDSADFIQFLNTVQRFDQDFDVMIEAKNKDAALFKLLHSLKTVSGIIFRDEASIEI